MKDKYDEVAEKIIEEVQKTEGMESQALLPVAAILRESFPESSLTEQWEANPMESPNSWPWRDSEAWAEEMRRRAERWVQDPKDRELLIPVTFDEGSGDGQGMHKAKGIYGDWVYMSDFQALAERFILAWELITTSESEPAPAEQGEGLECSGCIPPNMDFCGTLTRCPKPIASRPQPEAKVVPHEVIEALQWGKEHMSGYDVKLFYDAEQALRTAGYTVKE